MAPAVQRQTYNIFSTFLSMGLIDPISNKSRKLSTTVGTANNLVDEQKETNVLENMAAVDPPLEQDPESELGTPVNVITIEDKPDVTDKTDSGKLTKLPSLSGFDLRREDHRLETLKNWPAAKYVDPKPVARNGFYYFGEGDILRCNFCNVEHSDWWMFGEQDDDEEIGGDWWVIGGRIDDLKSKHAIWSKDCPFILGKPVGNVPNSNADEIYPLDAENRPHNTYYMSKEARLTSFRDWPKRMHQTPAEMAEAGFYYSGIGDHAVCFYCGGGLKDWEDNDDPMQEHELWFSRCPFVVAKNEQTRNILPPAVATTSYNKNSSVENVLSSESEVETPKSEIEQSAEQKYNDFNKLESTELSQKTKEFAVVCKICYSGEANITMIPCGHVLTCMACSLKITSCPACRSPVTSRMRIFYP